MIFSGTRTPAHDFTSPGHRRLLEDIPGSEVLDFDADEAKELWAEADAISPWAAPSRSRTTPTAATRPGSTRWRTS